LGMKVLRHEEYEDESKETCNGPYHGRSSKTMVGYGDEDNHFVVELIYNYGQRLYELGNDFQYISVISCKNNKKYNNNIIQNAQKQNYPIETVSNGDDQAEIFISSPDGNRFRILEEDEEAGDPIRSIMLHVTKLSESSKYWNGFLGISLNETKRYSNGDQSSTLSFDRPDHTQISLQVFETFSNAGKPINHATAFGRIAFACDSSKLKVLEEAVSKTGYKLLTPRRLIEKPGKATLELLTLADPDGYELTFVGEEGFRELSKVDSNAETQLQESIKSDQSVAWYAKHPTFRTSQ